MQPQDYELSIIEKREKLREKPIAARPLTALQDVQESEGASLERTTTAQLAEDIDEEPSFDNMAQQYSGDPGTPNSPSNAISGYALRNDDKEVSNEQL
ncbi:hypothetical protein U1Q18_044967 [Sarracenia purpurea var. burkii]